MKKYTLLLALILMCAQPLFAQVSFSCDTRTLFRVDLDSLNERTFNKIYSTPENSFFQVKNEYKMFVHTTEEMTSAYYANGVNSYDSTEGVWTFEAISDVGNKYTYYFDLTRNIIRTFMVQDNVTYLVVFNIKKSMVTE